MNGAVASKCGDVKFAGPDTIPSTTAEFPMQALGVLVRPGHRDTGN